MRDSTLAVAPPHSRAAGGACLFLSIRPLAHSYPSPAAPPVARNASSNSLSSIPPPFTSASGGNAATQDDLFASLVPPGGANGSSPFGPGGPSTGDDPFAAMLAAMSGAGGGVPGANPFGNMFPPPPGGGNGQDGGDPLAGLGGFQQQAAMEQEYSKAKTLSDKLFTLAHLLGVLALAACIVFVWEPVVLARRVNAGGSTAIPAVGVELVCGVDLSVSLEGDY